MNLKLLYIQSIIFLGQNPINPTCCYGPALVASVITLPSCSSIYNTFFNIVIIFQTNDSLIRSLVGNIICCAKSSAAIHWCRQNPGISDRQPCKTDQILLHVYRQVRVWSARRAQPVILQTTCQSAIAMMFSYVKLFKYLKEGRYLESHISVVLEKEHCFSLCEKLTCRRAMRALCSKVARNFVVLFLPIGGVYYVVGS